MGGFFPFLKCKFWSKSMMDYTLLNIIKEQTIVLITFNKKRKLCELLLNLIMRRCRVGLQSM